MGLLDLTPEQNAQLLGLAGGLLSNSGPSLQPRGFGQALGGGIQGMQQAQQQAMVQKLYGLQGQHLGLQNQQIQNQIDLDKQWMGNGAASTPTAPGPAQVSPLDEAQFPGVKPMSPAPQAQQANNPFAGVPPEVLQVAHLMPREKGLAYIAKYQDQTLQAPKVEEQFDVNGLPRKVAWDYGSRSWVPLGGTKTDMKSPGAEAQEVRIAGATAGAQAPYKGYPVQAGGSVVFPFGGAGGPPQGAMPPSPGMSPAAGTGRPPIAAQTGPGWQPGGNGSRVWSDPRISPNSMEGEAGKEIFTASDQASSQLQNTQAMRDLLGMYRQQGGSQGWTEPLRAQFSQVLAGFNIKPETLGLPADAGPVVAMDALANKMALGNIGPGGLPANAFSDADRKFVRDMQGNIKDPASAFEAKLIIAEAAAKRNQLKEQVYLSTVGDGKTIVDFRREWNKVKSQPMFDSEQMDRIRSLSGSPSKSGRPPLSSFGGN